MAGRGTDIILGGNPEFLARDYLKRMEINPDEASDEQFKEQMEKAKRVVDAEHKEVVAAGGLKILATERHESRRIDNQLRGRSGRQGDPGETQFVLSLEDDLMRIFAGDKVRSMMEWLGMEEGVAIESKTVSKQIERAQKAVEARNFETRKHVLKYDDVMNKQRETIYGLRRQLMLEPEHREYLLGDNGRCTRSFRRSDRSISECGRLRRQIGTLIPTRLRSKAFTRLIRRLMQMWISKK